MKVLVACEYSGTVRDAFLKLGHDAMSCDLLDTDVPGPHYKGDVRDVINDGWDLMIAHPPCTHLSVAGSRFFKHKQKEQQEALDFVRFLLAAEIPRICLENPVGVINSRITPPNQIIYPWYFGDEYMKRTCLWFKNLPRLQHTKRVGRGEIRTFESGRTAPAWYANALDIKDPVERMKIRSKTFPGIAEAMAEQWGKLTNEEFPVFTSNHPWVQGA